MSTKINTTTENIIKATLTANHNLNGQSIYYYLSANGGTNWELVTPNAVHTFVNKGNNLRWAAVLVAANQAFTPEIDSLSINFVTKKTLKRLQGETRYETAVEISKEGFPTGSEYVIIARGDLFPDALAGAPLCSKLNSPLLLTNSSSLTSSTKDEILRLKAKKAIVLGTEDAVSSQVETDLENQCSIKKADIKRIGGETRYETAADIAKELKPLTDKTCFVATGENYPDALACASIAAYKKIPIMLVRGDIGQIPQSTKDALKDLGITQAILTGQADVVPTSIEDYLKSQKIIVTRFGGDTRYDTCKLIADDALKNKGLNPLTICLAVGENFPDALTLGPFAGKNQSVILLTRTEFIPDSIKKFIATNKDNIYNVYIAGSSDVVSTQVEEEIKNIVGI